MLGAPGALQDAGRSLTEFPWTCSADGATALQLEVVRLREESAALAAQVKGYEVDVANLVSLGTVGHSNPKQKLQYNTQCAPPHAPSSAFRPAASSSWDDCLRRWEWKGRSECLSYLSVSYGLAA